MVKYLMTPTLLNSFSYYFKYEGEKEEEVRQSFIDLLHKDRFRMTPAMQRGIDFENNVQAYCEDRLKIVGDAPEQNVMRDIGNICKGGHWQKRVMKEIVINGIKFLLYGKCDVIKEDYIHDIKTTKNYDIGKYQDSAQHLLYMFCGAFKKFSYLIAQGGTYLNAFYKEDYFYTKDTKQQLITKINEFLGFLENDKEAKDLYFDKWKCKY